MIHIRSDRRRESLDGPRIQGFVPGSASIMMVEEHANGFRLENTISRSSFKDIVQYLKRYLTFDLIYLETNTLLNTIGMPKVAHDKNLRFRYDYVTFVVIFIEQSWRLKIFLDLKMVRPYFAYQQKLDYYGRIENVPWCSNIYHISRFILKVFGRQEVESATTTTTTPKLRGTNRKMSRAHHSLLWIVNAYHKA
ncbi:hypothetical protein V1477_004578 [Vespula maculifrons]|uniref:Uncharacterized protein n=1 Tax=Vespula maculifrons TaxID=7453 RepID=A0ABD2CPY7_VESMC